MRVTLSTLAIFVLFITMGCSKKSELSEKEQRTNLLARKWKIESRIFNGQETINDFFRSNIYSYQKDGIVIYNSPSESNVVRYWEWTNDKATQYKFEYVKGESDPMIINIVELSATKLRYVTKGYHAPQNNYDITMVPAQ